MIGRRGGIYYKQLPWARRIISITCVLMNKWIIGLKNPDTQAGFKGFNSKGRSIFLKTKINRYLQDTEFIKLAEKNNLKVSQIDIILRENIHFKNMGFKIIISELQNFLYLLTSSKKNNI